MKNAFHFMVKTFSVFAIFLFLSWLFGHVEKQLVKKVKDTSKIHVVTGWAANNYNMHIAQYLKK